MQMGLTELQCDSGLIEVLVTLECQDFMPTYLYKII